MDRRSFPNKKLSRLKKVQSSLQNRLANLSNSNAIDAINTAKRFRDKQKPISREDLLAYSTYVAKQLQIVTSKIASLEETSYE